MKKNSAIGETWNEPQKKICTPEEIAASNLRAALIGEADEDLKELCEKIEDEYDIAEAEKAYDEYIRGGKKSRPISKFCEELGL